MTGKNHLRYVRDGSSKPTVMFVRSTACRLSPVLFSCLGLLIILVSWRQLTLKVDALFNTNKQASLVLSQVATLDPPATPSLPSGLGAQYAPLR